MILAVAATDFEMNPLLVSCSDVSFLQLVCGVGPVESCLQLTRFLERNTADISLVVNFGVGGAYMGRQSGYPQLLDLCLAESDVLGDFGICFPRRVDELPRDITGATHFPFDPGVCRKAETALAARGFVSVSGNFVTVSCASGTRERGMMLQRKYNAICENMEGAALARVCSDFSLPLLQLRCISNYVDDRDPATWQLQQACGRCGEAAALLIHGLR